MFELTLFNALSLSLFSLADDIELNLKVFGIMHQENMDNLLHIFLIVFELLMLGLNEYLGLILHVLCKACSRLPIVAQAKLTRLWAKHCRSRLPNLLELFQEFITAMVRISIEITLISLNLQIAKRLYYHLSAQQVIGDSFTRDYSVQDADNITVLTKVMKILYYASMLAGELEEVTSNEENESTCNEEGASCSGTSHILQVSFLSVALTHDIFIIFICRFLYDANMTHAFLGSLGDRIRYNSIGRA